MSDRRVINNSKPRDMDASLPNLKVDFHCVKNNAEHRTQEISIDRLIIRRGKPFNLTLNIERSKQDNIELIFETGPCPSEEKGTQSSCSAKQNCGVRPGKRWNMKVLESTPSTVTLSVHCPPDACIGLYSLSVKTSSSTAPVKCLDTLTVLFNPWCEEDWVFLPNEAERQEYVMNEQGIVYQGIDKYVTTLDWDFGQFESDIVDICLKVLDLNTKCLKNPEEDFSARCNPIYVSRVVSAMINCDDDKGVLMGQWDGSYVGGVVPSHWSSSVDILRRWYKYDCHPVKFGQCWVFAAVMCTVMRCLGIPSRVVTNYESAHDTDQNLIVDENYSDYGVRPKPNRDTVWNYHVWVESWMRRPDLSEDKFYDGWQVLDPTPQEKSSGLYCCGPASVRAIREGHTNVKYDVPFVFGEVNADKICWLVMANGTKKVIHKDTSSVGQSISTKAVGSKERVDITESYKHPEGSTNERVAYDEAVKRVGDLKLSEAPPPPNVQMKLQLDGKPLNGVDIKLNLILTSNSTKPQDLSLKINAQVMRYTGNPSENVWSETKVTQLQPKEVQTIPLTVPFAQYGPKMLDNNCIKVSVIATDKADSKETFLVDRDIVPHSPTLSLTVTGTPLQNSEMTAQVVFENPLSVPLKNCSITLTGSGLLKQTEESRISELGPGQKANLKIKFRPYKAGPKRLVANFDSDTFKDIKASCDVNITPFSSLSLFFNYRR